MENSELKTEEDFKRRALKEAGLTYSITAVFPVLVSVLLLLILLIAGAKDYEKADWYLYLCYLIPQTCFAGAALFFFRRNRACFRNTYSVCKWYYFVLALVLQFGLLFSLSELNGYFIKLLELMGYQRADSTLPSLDGWNLLPALLVIAVLPALFEETIFRGILSRQMHESGWGLVPTVLISGALFSLFHHNVEQTLYQFVCGMCFTLIALRAGSVLPTIAAHFVNNALILILASTGNDNLTSLPTGGYLALIITSAICLVASLVFLIVFDKRGNQKGEVKHGKLFFLAAGVGIAVCAVEWVASLVQGFI